MTLSLLLFLFYWTERFVRLKDHKASTTLGIIMSAFIICWLPFFVLALLRPLFLQGKRDLLFTPFYCHHFPGHLSPPHESTFTLCQNQSRKLGMMGRRTCGENPLSCFSTSFFFFLWFDFLCRLRNPWLDFIPLPLVGIRQFSSQPCDICHTQSWLSKTVPGDSLLSVCNVGWPHEKGVLQYPVWPGWPVWAE